MTDSYLNFANSALGGKLADALGLPKPITLERYAAGQPVIQGSVLLGGGGEPQLLSALATAFQSMGVQTVAHAQLPQWVPVANQAGLMTGRWGADGKPGEKVKALVFDATGLTDSSQSDALYQFFHDAARSVLPCGRVVILGRPPEGCTTARQATIQRALEGLSRSLAKELKKAIAVQLVYVAQGCREPDGVHAAVSAVAAQRLCVGPSHSHWSARGALVDTSRLEQATARARKCWSPAHRAALAPRLPR